MLKNIIILLAGFTFFNIFARKLEHYNSILKPEEAKNEIT